MPLTIYLDMIGKGEAERISEGGSGAGVTGGKKGKEQNSKTRVARRAPCKTPASKGFLKFGIGEIFGDPLLNFYHSRPLPFETLPPIFLLFWLLV